MPSKKPKETFKNTSNKNICVRREGVMPIDMSAPISKRLSYSVILVNMRVVTNITRMMVPT